MLISKSKLAKIKSIIEKHYNNLTISVLGNSVFTARDLLDLKNAGVDVSNEKSFLELIYKYNLLNETGSKTTPINLKDLVKQQKDLELTKPEQKYSLEHLQENTKADIEKLKQNILTNMETVIREHNNIAKFQSLMGETKEDIDQLTMGKLKSALKDTSGEAERDWGRVVRTEMSNSISVGSVDRIAEQNKDKDLSEVYVYRITKNDASLCKFCNKFYNDPSDSNAPRIFKLSDLLKNGSNYGKKSSDWLPVATSTHPNERCSQVIELRPGWAVRVGGSVTFIGLKNWNKYIINKLKNS